MIKFLAKHKFRFDLGFSVLVFFNFVMSIIAAGDKLSSFFHVETKWIIAITVPSVLFLVWLGGSLMDRARFYHEYTTILNERNAAINKLLETQTTK